ncbi:MAG: bifunctional methylenetetrahydrofolate dehydrogenase/methenyltetrahydrofolate cyclohydrolase FolD [Clostridia bacterium]|nr:bifunctional methylenetetrahydrofolate dehydrogenase/methenyltetrahydrofolate cyclohydrolase FolD [Clostridia bacterium]
MAVLLDGKNTARVIREEIKKEVALFTREKGYAPGLTVILVGDDPASKVYVRNKCAACREAGILSETICLPASTTETDLLRLIDEKNRDKNVNGILTQLPLPSHIRQEKIIEAVSPQKDVDAFHPANVGKIVVGNYSFLPCTPAGVMELLNRYGISVTGKHCVVVGRSNIVGKPMASLLLEQNGTVTVCHSKTESLSQITREADILVSAVGKPRFITADMIKPHSCVIDVGINRLPDGSLCGDVDFANVEPLVSYITPVPGGVGPMTVAMLLRNTLTAAKLQALNDN